MAAERPSRRQGSIRRAAGCGGDYTALPDGPRFSVPEPEVLRRAAQLADREAALRSIVKRDGLMTAGSRGQVTLHPAAQELRLVEAQLVSQLQRVSVEDTGGKVEGPTRRRAVKAARARWDREHDELAAKRTAAGL